MANQQLFDEADMHAKVWANVGRRLSEAYEVNTANIPMGAIATLANHVATEYYRAATDLREEAKREERWGS